MVADIFNLISCLLSSLVSGATILYSLRCRAASGHPLNLHGQWFIAFCAAIFIWSFGSIFEAMAPTIVAKNIWVSVEYPGIALLAPCWFIFACLHTGFVKKIRWYVSWLFVVPALTLVLVLFSPQQLWVISGLASEGLFNDATYQMGWFNTAIALPHSYLLLFISWLLLARAYFTHSR
jgi:N-terminal 7TM region of histidine kinase